MFDNHYYNVNQTTKHIFQRLVLIFHLKNQLTLTIINGHYDCFVFFVCCHPFDKSFVKKNKLSSFQYIFNTIVMSWSNKNIFFGFFRRTPHSTPDRPEKHNSFPGLWNNVCVPKKLTRFWYIFIEHRLAHHPQLSRPISSTYINWAFSLALSNVFDSWVENVDGHQAVQMMWVVPKKHLHTRTHTHKRTSYMCSRPELIWPSHQCEVFDGKHSKILLWLSS